MSGNLAPILRFAQLIDFHLARGTRPDGKPGKPGRQWSNKRFAHEIGINERTVRNWRRGATIPVDLEPVEKVFFGESNAYDDWRAELREAHRAARSAGGGNSTEPVSEGITTQETALFENGPGMVAVRALVTLLAERIINGPAAGRRSPLGSDRLAAIAGPLTAFSNRVTHASPGERKHRESFADMREGVDLTLAMSSLGKARLREAVEHLFDALEGDGQAADVNHGDISSPGIAAKDAEKRVRQHRDQIRDLHGQWLSSIEGRFDTAAAQQVLSLASSLEGELKFLELGRHGCQRWISLDTNVIWHYMIFGGEGKPTLESAISCYVASNREVPFYRTIAPRHRDELSAVLEGFVRRAGSDDPAAASALHRLRELWGHALTPWPEDADVEGELPEAHKIFRRLRQTAEPRGDDYNKRRDAETVAQIAKMNERSMGSSPPMIVSLVTADRSIVSLGLEANYNQCIQHIYGPAWGMFCQATFGAKIDYSYIGHLASTVAMAKHLVSDNLRRQHMGTKASRDELIYLGRFIGEFGELLEPFHANVSRCIEEMCDQQIALLDVLRGPGVLSGIVFDALVLLEELRSSDWGKGGAMSNHQTSPPRAK